MDAASPVFAALGVAGYRRPERSRPLARRLPSPRRRAETAGWAGGWVDQVLRAATGAAGREG